MVLKFSKGKDNLDKLLESQRMSFNKEDIRYNSFNKNKTYKNFFTQEASKKMNLKYMQLLFKKGSYISFMSY